MAVHVGTCRHGVGEVGRKWADKAYVKYPPITTLSLGHIAYKNIVDKRIQKKHVAALICVTERGLSTG